MSRKMIQEFKEISGPASGTIDELLKHVESLKKKYGGDAGVSEDYDGRWTIAYKRPETDAEYEKRMARAERNKEANAKRKATLALQKERAEKVAAAQEKKLFERLKAKYEGK